MTITAGSITVVSAGSRQGVFCPTLRIYYQHERYGLLYHEIVKPIRCRSRSRALELGKEWRTSPAGRAALADAFKMLAARDGVTIPPFGEVAE